MREMLLAIVATAVVVGDIILSYFVFKAVPAASPEPDFAVAVKFFTTVLAGAGVIFTCLFSIWKMRDEEKQRQKDEAKRRENLAAAAAAQERLVEIEKERHASHLREQLGWREEDRRWLKVENAIRLLERWDQPAYMLARDFVRHNEAARERWSNDDLREQIKNNAELDRSIRLMLNYFDDVRQSLKRDRVPPEVVRDSLHETYERVFRFFEPWIDKEQAKHRNDLRELRDLLKVTAS